MPTLKLPPDLISVDGFAIEKMLSPHRLKLALQAAGVPLYTLVLGNAKHDYASLRAAQRWFRESLKRATGSEP